MLNVYFFVAISAGFGCLREELKIVLVYRTYGFK